MSMQDALLSSRRPESRLLLAAYLAIETDLKAQAAAARREAATTPAEIVEPIPESDGDESFEEAAIGWVPRLRQVAGIAPEQLGPLHGQLIALGLLKFQLTGRTSGILYRVSVDGRAELEKLPGDAGTDWSELSAA
jgi:hypothetical protein